MGIKYVNSTFGIDVTKKVINGRSNTSEWLKGTLDESSLKDIRMTYEEEFGEPFSKQVKEEFDNITKAAVSMIKKAVGVVQGLAMGESLGESISGAGDDKDGDLTQALLTLGTATAIAQDLGGDNTGYNNLTSFINNAIGKIPAYNIPTRKTIPGISIGFGDKLKIKFQYGSCGEFNAKTEVYDPIKTIMIGLNKLSVSDGVVSIEGTGGIPFELGGMMAKYAVFQQIKSGDNSLSSITTKTKDAVSSVAEMGKTTKKLLNVLEDMSKWRDKIESSTDSGDLDKYLQPSYYDMVDAEEKPAWWQFWKSGKVAAPNDKTKEAMDALAAWRDDSKGAGETFLSMSETYFNDAEKYNDLVKQANEYSSTNTGAANNVFTALNSLVSVQPNIVNGAMKDVHGKLSGEWYLQFGFMGADGQNIFYSLKDIEDGIITKKTIKHKLQLTGIPQKVSCGFDFSDVDKDGYPKSGYIAIEKLWIVNPLSTFSNTFNP